MPAVSPGEQINDLIDSEKWEEARALIEKGLEDEPKSHWLLTQLGVTYYEQRQYKKALGYLLQSKEIVPDCPLTLWHLAGTLDALGYHGGALSIYTWLLESRKTAEDDPCWESAEWTDALKTDCVYRLGLCLRNMKKKDSAVHCFRQYIRLLSVGASGSYPIEEALRQITLLQRIKHKVLEIELQKAAEAVRRETGEAGKATELPKLDRKKLQQLQDA